MRRLRRPSPTSRGSRKSWLPPRVGPASPELLDWIRDTKRHVRRTYITPPEFLNRGLITCMEVLLTADGRVIGEPALLRSSGDPFWDDNAARAVARASPLPAPPADGEWIFCFPSEERQ